jgi:double-stranded uracil-DNA glycosylase
MRSSEIIGARIGAVDERTGLGYDVVLDDGSASELLPLALAELHRATPVGARVRIRVGADWNGHQLGGVLEGAGFCVEEMAEVVHDGDEWLAVEVTRMRSLPDTVGPGMRTLLVGLNPSPSAADCGVGFARPGNRFWPAALAAGLVTRDRDPLHALRAHGVGMTDLVKRTTVRADEVGATEYREGAARVEALVLWLAPGTVCFVGLSGYRIAVDRAAVTGWQPRSFGGRPAYVMPNPSGLNARATPAVLAEHLRRLPRGAD